MEVYLSRTEVRALVASLINETTSTALSAQVLEMRNAQIDAAYLKTAQDCRWARSRGRETLALGIQQNRLNYPAGVGTGGLVELAWYDTSGATGGTSRYVPIVRRMAPAAADQDQEQIAGGSTLSDVCGPPQFWWDEGGQIAFWPYSDQAYAIRALWAKAPRYPNDGTPSIVDGQLIAYFAASLARRAKGDNDGAANWLAMYQDRRMALQAWQSTGETVALVSDASMDENEQAWYNQLPRWDVSPTVR